MEEQKMELQIIKQVNPLVEWNKEELRNRVTKTLKKYKGLVFADDSIKDAKSARSELNNLKKEMNAKAIEIDKEMSKDIKEFRKEVNEIIALVVEAVEPIDAQIKVFEQAKKDKKRNEINDLITTTITEYGLDEKHAAQLTITDKYLNASEKIPKITTDLKNRAEVLKVAQTTVEKNRELVIETCKMYENQATLDVNAYLKLLETGRESGEIVANIHSVARAQIDAREEEKKRKAQAELEAQQKAQREAFEAEQRAREEAMRAEYEAKQAELQKQAEEPTPEPVEHVEPIRIRPEVLEGKKTTHTFEIRGTAEQIAALRKLMESIRVDYKEIKAPLLTKESRPVWA